MSFFDQINGQIFGALEGVVSQKREDLLIRFGAAVGSANVAAIEFDAAAGTDDAAITVGGGLIELAGTLTKDGITDDAKETVKAIVSKVIGLPDANQKAKAVALFGTLVEVIDAVKDLAADENAAEPPAE